MELNCRSHLRDILVADIFADVNALHSAVVFHDKLAKTVVSWNCLFRRKFVFYTKARIIKN